MSPDQAEFVGSVRQMRKLVLALLVIRIVLVMPDAASLWCATAGKAVARRIEQLNGLVGPSYGTVATLSRFTAPR